MTEKREPRAVGNAQGSVGGQSLGLDTPTKAPPGPQAQRTVKPWPFYVTGFYLASIASIDNRIRSLRLTMQECDDRSGLQDGFTAKLLHPHSKNGRQVRWETLQLLIDALWPHGVRVTISGLPAPAGIGKPASAGTEKPTPPRASMYVPTSEQASDMARLRLARMKPQQRSALARRAARARWRRVREDRGAMNRRGGRT